LHGHSVGGTNPSLLEAMATKTFILSHDNRFNKSVIEENAFYFSNSEELVSLLKNENLTNQKETFALNNLKKIDSVYRWAIVVAQYESYFKRILKESNRQ
jgi:glycosyltransferase involved in cell wall biosynthesis